MIRPDNPLDRRIAIMDLFDSGRLTDHCTAEEVVKLVGGTPQGTVRTLKSLGFEIVRKRSTKREKIGKGKRTRTVHVPREWGRKRDWAGWPQLFAIQRNLRKLGLSAGAVARASKGADVPTDILEKAVAQFVGEESRLRKRGQLKAAVNKLMEVERENTTPTQALMEALRETGGNREYLLRRVEAFGKRNRQFAEENKALKETLKLLEENNHERISHEASGGVFTLAPQRVRH